MPPSARPTRRFRIAAAAAAGILAVLAGIVLAPRPPQLSAPTAGDPALVADVADALRDASGAFDRVSVAVIDGDGVRRAHFGAHDGTVYEIGSVTKTMTASLLQIAVERGEVTLDTRLGDLLDLGDSPSGEVTLEQLATHRSGLPRLSPNPARIASRLLAVMTAGDPYGSTVDELVSDARAAAPGDPAFAYSNFGFALLGQALAAAAGTTWPELVRERLHEPLAMSGTSAADTPEGLPADAPTGYTDGGRPSAAWTLGADAPAGNVRSTLDDMVVYLSAQLDGSAPGSGATEPRVGTGGNDGERIGLAWFTTADGVTWHNGATGGFSSFAAFDRERGRGVVVLSSTANPDAVDALGMSLIGGRA